TSILGSLQLLSAGTAGPLPDEAREMIEIAARGSRRLLRLVSDLLDLEKLQSGKMSFRRERVDLAQTASESIATFTSLAGAKRVRLELRSEIPNAFVTADADRVAQVLANLLSNAIKFSPDGASVLVTVERRSAALRVSVRDAGPGVPDDFRARIFAPFSQADGSDSTTTGGSGLGLSISREIVNGLGGEIGFESRVGDGACFYFELAGVVEGA
ncbi:MAG TPA: HAMP domain-containing sensor histidine kinase, partial [Polyangiaceae bacterium]